MRVFRLASEGTTYTANAHLVLGDWSALGDVNTLVDVGRDPSVLGSLAQAPTGVGKRAVEQVILTHGHYDHVELLPLIRTTYRPMVCAFRGVEMADREVRDGDLIQAGDRILEVIHCAGHSSDSICLLDRQDGVLFAGDAPLRLRSPGGTYDAAFAAALERICASEVRAIHFGHGPPLLAGCNTVLQQSLEIARQGNRPCSGVKRMDM